MATEVSKITASTAGYIVNISSTSTEWVTGSTGLYIDASNSKDGDYGILAVITSTATGDATITLIAGDYWRNGIGNKSLTVSKPASGNNYAIIKLEESARFIDSDGYFNFNVGSADVSVIGIEFPKAVAE